MTQNCSRMSGWFFTTALRRGHGIVPAIVLALTACSLTAFADEGELAGTWNNNGRFSSVTHNNGRVHFRYQGTLYARGWQNGTRIQLQREQDGQWVQWNGTIVAYQNGLPHQIRMDDGALLQRWPGPATPAPAPATPGPATPPAPLPGPALPGPVLPGPGGVVSSNPPGPANPTYPEPSYPSPQPEPELPPPAVLYNLTGEWTSNLGMRYRISQNGDSFSWTVDGLPQTGQGTISGTRLSATWRGAVLRGSGMGTIRLGVNGPERIEFDNGLVLAR